MINKNRNKQISRSVEFKRHIESWSKIELRYPALLAVLLLFFVGHPMVAGLFQRAYFFDLFLAFATLAVGFTLLTGPNRRWVAVGLGIPAIFLSISSHVIGPAWHLGFSILGHLFGMVFLSLGITVVVAHVLLANTSIVNKITGSICGYLLIGISFAVAASMLDEIRPDSYLFNEDLNLEIENDSARMNLFVYYSFVTLTTLGYGDITPIAPTSRTLAWAEAVFGQFYLAILVAGLVSQLSIELRHRDHSG